MNKFILLTRLGSSTNKSITATWWQHTKIVVNSTKENLSASFKTELANLKLIS